MQNTLFNNLFLKNSLFNEKQLIMISFLKTAYFMQNNLL